MWRAAVLTLCTGLLGACTLSAKHALGPNLAHARASGAPLLIYALGVPGEIQTRADRIRVPVYVQFVVTGSEKLSRVEFTLTGYTVRGLPIRKHGRRVAIQLIGPGPFLPNRIYEVNSFHSRPAGFPGSAVACVALFEAQITYPGGERKTLSSKGLRDSLVPALRKGCSDRGPTVDGVFSGN